MKTLLHFAFCLLITSFFYTTSSTAQVFQPNLGTESFETPPTTYPSNTATLDLLAHQVMYIKNRVTGEYLTDNGSNQTFPLEQKLMYSSNLNHRFCWYSLAHV